MFSHTLRSQPDQGFTWDQKWFLSDDHAQGVGPSRDNIYSVKLIKLNR